MRKLAILCVALALVAVSFYGCDETNPTEPTATAAPSLGVGGMPTALSSTFDSDDEGWTLAGDSRDGTGHGSGSYWLQPHHIASGGNPGGAIYAIDGGKGVAWFFQAPPKFLGNRSGAYGGTLEYDIKYVGTGNHFYTADVVLAGNGKTLSIHFTDESDYPGSEWKHYSVELSTDADWRVENPFLGPAATEQDIRDALKDLNVLLIRGEYDGSIDTGYLDNVRFVPKGRAK